MTTHHNQLGEFLRTSRAAVSPGEVGLPLAGRRMTGGLRREEVATLSNVSLSWYTALEQGRRVGVSEQVLGAIVRALRLDAVGARHAFELAGLDWPGMPTPLAETAPPELVQFVQHLPVPAVLAGRRWDRIAWNSAFVAVFEDRSAPAPAPFREPPVPGLRRNMLWSCFMEPALRTRFIDWPAYARDTLAEFRASANRYLEEPAFHSLVALLEAQSPEFAEWWSLHELRAQGMRTAAIQNAAVGRLDFHKLTVYTDVELGLMLTLLIPNTEDGTATKLEQLLAGRPGVAAARGAAASPATARDALPAGGRPPADVEALRHELARVTEQRDRMAATLTEMNCSLDELQRGLERA